MSGDNPFDGSGWCSPTWRPEDFDQTRRGRDGRVNYRDGRPTFDGRNDRKG